MKFIICLQASIIQVARTTILEDQTITSQDFVPVGGTQDPNPADRIITITNPVTTMDNALDKWNVVMERMEWGLANSLSFMVKVIYYPKWFAK